MGKSRVFILYSYPLFAQGIESILRQVGEFEIVGMARADESALERIRESRPDVILVDSACNPGAPLGSVMQVFVENLGDKVITFDVGDNTLEVFRRQQVLVTGPDDLVAAIRSA